MTRTRARQVASRVVGYGSPGEPGRHLDDYLICPLCHDLVSLAGRPWPRYLKAPSGAEMRDALTRHLLDADEESRCAQVASVRPGSAVTC